MDALDGKVADVVSNLIKKWVVQGVLPAERQTEAVMAVTALEGCRGRAAARGSLTQLRQDEARLADSIRARTGVEAAPDDRFAGKPGGELRALTGALGAGRKLSTSEMASIARDVRAFMVCQYETQDPLIREGIAPIFREFDLGEAAAIDPLMIDRDRMQAFADARFPDREIIIKSVEALSGGYSKGTYIVDMEEGGVPTRVVLRQDKPGLPTGSSVADEFPVLQELHARGVKVPSPEWLENDTSFFGAAVMATGFAPGKPGRTFPDAPDLRRKWALSAARFLGSLHCVRPDRPGDVRDFMRQTLDDFRRRLAEVEDAPRPGLSFGLAWLEQNLDLLKGRPVCRTHGDLAFHNILMHEDEVSAVVDWEFTQFSDPSEDISYIKPFICELGNWNEFVEEYRSLTGFDYDEAVGKWFTIFGYVRIALVNATILKLNLTTDLCDVALLVAGGNLLPKWEVEFLQKIGEGA